MKTLKLGIFSLLAIFAVSVFFTSCEQDFPNVVESDLDEPSSFDHHKDIEILSENGLSKITITASGNDVSVLDEIKQADFKIIPIFEKLAETSVDENYDVSNTESYDMSNNTEALQDDIIPIEFSVADVELEEGAIGYKMEVKPTNIVNPTNNKKGAYWVYHSWSSSHNKAQYKAIRGCFAFKTHKQLHRWSPSTNSKTYYRWCGGDNQPIIVQNGSPSHKMWVHVVFSSKYLNGYYEYYFYD